MNEPEKPKKGWGCVIWSSVIIAAVLTGLYLMPCTCCVPVRANQMKGMRNARDIIGGMMAYASDNHGQYPDQGLGPAALTSNAAFHRLFTDGLVQDESIFGCPSSMFMPDKNIGTAPEYDQALTAGENHWVLVAGLNTDSPAHYPLIMENAVDTTWPPRWLVGAGGKPLKGRAWQDDNILVGFNDGTVQKLKLKKTDGFFHLPKSLLEPKGKTPLPVMKVLDIIPRGAGSYGYGQGAKSPPWGRDNKLPPLNAPAGQQ